MAIRVDDGAGGIVYAGVAALSRPERRREAPGRIILEGEGA